MTTVNSGPGAVSRGAGSVGNCRALSPGSGSSCVTFSPRLGWVTGCLRGQHHGSLDTRQPDLEPAPCRPRWKELLGALRTGMRCGTCLSPPRLMSEPLHLLQVNLWSVLAAEVWAASGGQEGPRATWQWGGRGLSLAVQTALLGGWRLHHKLLWGWGLSEQVQGEAVAGLLAGESGPVLAGGCQPAVWGTAEGTAG